MSRQVYVVDTGGMFQDVELLTDDIVTVTQKLMDMPDSSEKMLAGYYIPVAFPSGLMSQPKFDLDTWMSGDYDTLQELWGESLSAEEIEELKKNNSNPVPIQKVLEAKIDLLSVATDSNLAHTQREIEIKKRIDAGEITADNFNSLSPSDQQIVQLVLFKNYSPKSTDVAKSLSAIEISLVYMVKIFNKLIDSSSLTEQEKVLYKHVYDLFSLNDMPIDSIDDWRVQYLTEAFTYTQENRMEYFTKKMEVIGKI